MRHRIRRLRRRLSPYDVQDVPGSKGATVTIRVRWWAWPGVMLSAVWRNATLRPRAAWVFIAPWLLLLGLRQSMRALRGAA